MDTEEKAALLRRIAELEASACHQTSRLEALRQIGTAFSTNTPNAVATQALELVIRLLKASAGTLFVVDAKRQKLCFQFVHGEAKAKLEGQLLPADHGVVGYVFQTGNALIGDIDQQVYFNPAMDQQTLFHTARMATIRLEGRGRLPVGVIQILNTDVPFTAEDAALLHDLAPQVALALDLAHDVERDRLAAVAEVVGAQSHQIKNFVQRFSDLDLCLDTVHYLQTEFTQPEGVLFRELQTLDSALLGLKSLTERLCARASLVAQLTKDGTLPPPDFHHNDLRRLFREVDSEQRLLYRQAGVSLKLDCSSNVPEFLFDYEQIYDAVFNLVHNALPHVLPGGTVTVEAACEGEGVMISVQDTGVGMPPERLAALLEGDAVSTTLGGTGLGFRIARAVVEQTHGGRLEGESTPGVGTTFRMWLPANPKPALR